MRLLKNYIDMIHILLEKPRNELEYSVLKHNNRKKEKMIRKYDSTILDKYKYIEQIIDEELKN